MPNSGSVFIPAPVVDHLWFKPQKSRLIHEIEHWNGYCSSFFEKIATLNQLRIRQKTLNSNTTSAPVVDNLCVNLEPRASAEKFLGEEGQRKKRLKIAKKTENAKGVR